jgi:hypothetical protein
VRLWLRQFREAQIGRACHATAARLPTLACRLFAPLPGERCVALRAGVLQGRLGGRRIAVPLGTVQRVVAAEQGQPARAQFGNAVHAAQQLPIVAHHHHGALGGLQPAQQPGAGLRVEVVAGLVEDDAVSVGRHGAGQGHAHSLTAAQAGHRVGGLQAGEARFGQDLRHAGAQVPMAIGQDQVVRRCQPGGEPLHRFEHRAEAHRLADTAPVLGQQRRGDEVNAAAAPYRAGRRHAAGQHLREHALAHAVAADDAQPFAADGQVQRLLPQRPAVGQMPLDVVELERGGIG